MLIFFFFIFKNIFKTRDKWPNWTEVYQLYSRHRAIRTRFGAKFRDFILFFFLFQLSIFFYPPFFILQQCPSSETVSKKLIRWIVSGVKANSHLSTQLIYNSNRFLMLIILQSRPQRNLRHRNVRITSIHTFHWLTAFFELLSCSSFSLLFKLGSAVYRDCEYHVVDLTIIFGPITYLLSIGWFPGSVPLLRNEWIEWVVYLAPTIIIIGYLLKYEQNEFTESLWTHCTVLCSIYCIINHKAGSQYLLR